MGGNLTMKKVCIFFAAIIVVLVNVQPAMANLGPDLHVSLSVILIPLTVALLSLLGGVYDIFDRMGKKNRYILKALVVIICFCVSVVSVSGSIFVLIFGFYAVGRAVKMIVWGIQAGSYNKDRVYLAFARPWRLVTAGVLLVLATFSLYGMAIVYDSMNTFVPLQLQENHKQSDLKNIFAYQVAYAYLQKEKNGQLAFERLPADFGFITLYTPYSDMIIEFTPDRKHFAAFISPRYLPHFPFNYLVSRSSYRVDDSGQIRMIRVHQRGNLCPKDATLVMQLEREAVIDAFDKLTYYLTDSGIISVEASCKAWVYFTEHYIDTDRLAIED
jgi:hypothetical protein